MDTEKTSGLSCPQCGGYIPLSLEELLKCGTITCPHCDLHMTINRKVADKTREVPEKSKRESKKKTDV